MNTKQKLIALIGALTIAATAYAATNIYDGSTVKHLRAPSVCAVGQQTNTGVLVRSLVGKGFVIINCSDLVTNAVLQGSADNSTWADISNTAVTARTNLILRVDFDQEAIYFRTIIGASATNATASAVAIGAGQVN